MTLLELLALLRKHVKLVIFLPLFFAVAMAAYAWLVMPNVYSASASMYVLNSGEAAEERISNGDLSASQMLTNDVASLIKSNRVANDTAKALGMEDLDDVDIVITSSTSTRLISVEVTGTDSESVADIANKMVDVTSDVAQEIMEFKVVNVVDEAAAPTSPSGPNRVMYTVIALLAGFLLAIIIVVLLDTLNTRVRSADELEELLGVPTLGRIPDMG